MSQSRASSPTGWISFYQFGLPEAFIAPFKNVRFPNSGMPKWLLFRGQPLFFFFFFRGENEKLLVNGKYQQWSEAPRQSVKHVSPFKTKPPQAEEGENQWVDQNVLSMSLYHGVFLTHDGLIDCDNVFFFFLLGCFSHIISHYLTSGSASCINAFILQEN